MRYEVELLTENGVERFPVLRWSLAPGANGVTLYECVVDFNGEELDYADPGDGPPMDWRALFVGLVQVR